MEFVGKGLSGIFVTSEEDVQLIHEFWKEHDDFEYGYLNHDTIKVVSKEELSSNKGLLIDVDYNGKFDGDIPALFEHFTRLGKEIKIITGINIDGFIMDEDVFTNYATNENVAEKVADLIIEHCDIRGIELEDYKRNLTSDTLVSALKLLFEQNK